jgi:translation initiation factor 4A
MQTITIPKNNEFENIEETNNWEDVSIPFRPNSPVNSPKREKELEENTEKEIRNWDEMDLKFELLRGIYSYGFEIPSDIQKKAILPIVSGRDVIAQAQSGSGKTGTFTIGVLQRIDISKKKTQALILAPTHELAKQISVVIQSIGNMMEGLVVKTLLGGTSIRDDLNEMRENTPHVIVGCVGRVFDMMSKGHIEAREIDMFVLDEADEMLSKGFGENIRNMFSMFFRDDIQVVLFSATIPSEILRLTQQFMRNPIKITMKPDELNLKCIQQFFVAVQNDMMKFMALKDLFSLISVSKCIIYCNSVRRVQELYHAMVSDNYSVCCIHSMMDKQERETIFNQFRYGDHRVLISSDITARGIDIQQVSTVINYDIPRCVHNYLHRIGRSGRWGRKGFAINFVTKQDIHDMHAIEKHYSITIDELPAKFNFIV